MEKADHAVLGTLEANALDPRMVATIIDMVVAQLTPANAESNIAALRRDLRVLDGTIANLTAVWRALPRSNLSSRRYVIVSRNAKV